VRNSQYRFGGGRFNGENTLFVGKGGLGAVFYPDSGAGQRFGCFGVQYFARYDFILGRQGNTKEQ